MADLRINPNILESLLRRYRPEGVTKDGIGGTTEFVMLCPFHPETLPSFHLNLHKGVGFCFGCPKKKSYTLDEIIAELEGKSTRQAASFLRQEGVYEKAERAARTKDVKEDSCAVTMEQVDGWHSHLLQNATAIAELVRVTGWTLDTINRFRIGYTGTWYSIPLITMNSVVMNVKYYNPKGRPKYKGEREFNTPKLWPLESFEKPGTIWLMEGEKDCILAMQNGLAAVTFTSGAGKVALEYLSRFKGRDVYIVYDIDPAGRSGAVTAAEHLIRVANSVKILEIPEEGLPATGDFTDFVHHAKHNPVELHQVAQMTESVKLKDSRTKVVIPDEVIDTYLEEVITKKLFFRRVRMRVRVVSMSKCATYLVPKETVVNCGRNLGEQCFSCALNFTEGQPITLHMRPEYPEIMQLIDSSDSQQRTALKTLLELYPKCLKMKFEFKAFQAFYPIVLIPALEKDKANHSYVMQTAWALDVPSEANEDYLAEAVVMTNPNDQMLVIVCYKLDKDTASVDAFELTDELKEGLKVFQCTASVTSTLN